MWQIVSLGVKILEPSQISCLIICYIFYKIHRVSTNLAILFYTTLFRKQSCLSRYLNNLRHIIRGGQHLNRIVRGKDVSFETLDISGKRIYHSLVNLQDSNNGGRAATNDPVLTWTGTMYFEIPYNFYHVSLNIRCLYITEQTGLGTRSILSLPTMLKHFVHGADLQFTPPRSLLREFIDFLPRYLFDIVRTSKKSAKSHH